jgi:hypothetical protein
MNRRLGAALAVLLVGCAASSAEARNLQLVDENPATGFAIYRSGKPSEDDLRQMCELHLTEILVLSGDAADCENRWPEACPSLVVAKEVHQSDKQPLSGPFLKWFDGWVEDAMRQGKRIAFRCDCGCHRTGRLAAYYELKYEHLSLEEAKAHMLQYGHWMVFHGWLEPQVTALSDYIAGRPCSTDARYCVRPDDD